MKIQTCYHMVHSASKLMFTYIQPGEKEIIVSNYYY